MNQKFLESLLKFLIFFTLIIWVNVFVSKFIFRFDLSEDKKYTISDASKKLLQSLEYPVDIELYLAGEMPSDFKRLQRAFLEKVEEFRTYSKQPIRISIVDPNEAKSKNARAKFQQSLIQKGVLAKNVQDKKKGKIETKRLFPGGMIFYKGTERPINILSENDLASAQGQLNQSIEGLEYELSTALRFLSNPDKKRIGIIKGYQSLDTLALADITNSLLEDYKVYSVDLPNRLEISGYDCIIIPKPTRAFSQQDKFKIDQYLMNGGTMLLLIDQLAIDMDKAGQPGGTLAISRDLNLRDLLFKYGLRVNVDLVQDLYSGVLPVVTGSYKDKPDIQLLPWPYFPIINNNGTHSSVKNIGSVLTRFASTIDTVKAKGIKKTPILLTSQNAKSLPTPITVNMNDVAQFDQKQFPKSEPKALGYLLEGSFKSLFANRFLPAGVAINDLKNKSIPTKMVVISDGDFIKNEVNPQTGQAMELGYDPFLRKKFANKTFLKNIIEYLVDKEGIVMMRNNTIIHRPLDKQKVVEERAFWQYLNLIGPITLLLLFGIIYFFWRKWKYGKQINA